MKNNIICDLDGTLALDDHRAHLIQENPNNRKWDEYFSLCMHDAPNEGVLLLLRMCRYQSNVHILSARSMSTFQPTIDWLKKYQVQYTSLRLRGLEDRTDDYILKLQWAKELDLTPENTLFVLEDRQRVVDAWREGGYTCFQVAPGKF